MGHKHFPQQPGRVGVARLPRNVLLVVLAVAAILTGSGLVALWPNHDQVTKVASSFRTQFAAPGVTFPSGVITKITDGCPGDDQYGDGSQAGTKVACKIADVKILTGKRTGQITQIQLDRQTISAGLVPGDKLKLMSTPPVPNVGGTVDSLPGAEAAPVRQTEFIFGVMRNVPLMVLLMVFVLIVVGVARLRGFLALVALAISGFVLIGFLLPALISGGPGLAIALAGSAAIMFVVLYVAHGPSVRTSVALAGTLCGIGITGAVAQFSVGFTRLSGIADESDAYLAGMAGGLDFRGLVTCGIIIAGLGVLNDVTITQASSMWELRAAAPEMSRRQLFARGMRIGRDHIASTIYTIVFAYAGAALSVLLLVYLYNRPMLELLTQDDIATEIVRTLCSAIGLVLAVPITTGIAVLMIPPEGGSGRGRAREREEEEYVPWDELSPARKISPIS